MAFRSDRRGDEPITSLALEAVTHEWCPACDFHHGPETSHVSLDEAEDTNAGRPRHNTCHSALAEGVQMELPRFHGQFTAFDNAASAHRFLS